MVPISEKNEYIINIIATNDNPFIIRFLNLLATHLFTFELILIFVERLMGINSDDYKRSIVINKKINTGYFRKEFVYQEEIPKDIKENEIRNKIFFLRKQAKSGTFKCTLEELINKQKRIFG